MSRALASIAKAMDWTPMPAVQCVLRCHTATGPDATGMFDRHGTNARSGATHSADLDVPAPQSLGGPHDARSGDFSRVPARAPNSVAEFSDDAVEPSSAEGNAASAAESKTGAAEETAADIGETPVPQQSANVNGKVTSLDLITGSSGAVTGFPAVTGGGVLDSPGPFNDTTTGACRNIHQMKFTLTGHPQQRTAVAADDRSQVDDGGNEIGPSGKRRPKSRDGTAADPLAGRGGGRHWLQGQQPEFGFPDHLRCRFQAVRLRPRLQDHPGRARLHGHDCQEHVGRCQAGQPDQRDEEGAEMKGRNALLPQIVFGCGMLNREEPHELVVD
jgi:hypothetical protein